MANGLSGVRIHLKVKLHSFPPPSYPGVIAAGLLLLLLIAGCVISPRRIVVGNNPSPTPTPDISPTPTPSITPTPTPAAAPVPRTSPQFLFLGDAASPLLTGFRLNSDGSLAPLPGSPYPAGAPVRALQSMQNVLIVETRSGATAYIVNQETGLLAPADSSAISKAFSSLAPQAAAAAGRQMAVLDASGEFMYVVDANRAELLAFRVEKGKASALLQSYPMRESTGPIALVQP